MPHLNIDIETFSTYDLKTCGVYKYIQSPEFQILLCAYSVDSCPIEVVNLIASEESICWQWLKQALTDPAYIKHAYNAQFEITCLQRALSIALPVEQWRCTQLHGLYLGYPGSLDALGQALELPEDKRKKTTGKALINYFSKPCKSTKANGGRTRNLPHHDPDKWAAFKDYCAGDVITERAVLQRLNTFSVPTDIQKQWETDIAINARGVGVDKAFVERAIALWSGTQLSLLREATELTGLENPNSVAQLTGWLEQRLGYRLPGLTKESVETLLSGGIDDNARRMLEIRQELGKTSLKKYNAITEAICDDGRLRGLFQFYGANRTGRWAGRLVQMHNLPKNDLPALDLARTMVKENKQGLSVIFGPVSNTLSQLIRTAFTPSPGNVFVDADFSSIEARIISWLAGESWRLEVFKTHGKIYEASAAQMFGVPITSIAKGQPNYALRQRGKVAELALGYQGGAGALISMGALKMGLSEDELPEIVRLWRRTNARIVDLWHNIEAGAIHVIGGASASISLHGLILAREINPLSGLDFFTIQLPSKRKLYYVKPRLKNNRWGQPAITYMGMDQTSKKWIQQDAYGGKLVENIVQAFARDCLAEAIERVTAAGHDVVCSVHDEILIDTPNRCILPEIIELMIQPMPWAPDLPLAANGWVGDYYKKD